MVGKIGGWFEIEDALNCGHDRMVPRRQAPEVLVATLSASTMPLRNLDWFEVTDIRGQLGTDGNVQHFQVTLKVGFCYED